MIVYGKNVAKEIITSKKRINKVYISKKFNDNNILSNLKNCKIIRMEQKELDKIANKNHQGIILDIEDFKYEKLETILNENLIVMLDHLEDPHNLGAIIRTCETAGVKSIIIPKKRSVGINSTVMKVSAGALNNIKIIEVNNLVDAIKKLKEKNFWIYGADMEKSQIYTDISYDEKTVLVIGAEGNGLSRLVKENCDFIVSIPMHGKINSLNASVAASLIIYEVIRQRR